MTSDDVPTLVRGLRKRLGLTQEQFAQEIGVTYSTVNRWENGRRRPQPFLVKRLVEMRKELAASNARKKSARRKPPQ